MAEEREARAGQRGGAARLYELLLAVALGLNAVWESWHAVWLYDWTRGWLARVTELPQFVRLIGRVTVVDALIIGAAAGLTGLLWRSPGWLRRPGWRQLLLFAVVLIFWAAVIEWRGVFWRGDWAYDETMPVVFGVGVSPLLQLAVTGVVSVLAVSYLLGWPWGKRRS